MQNQKPSKSHNDKYWWTKGLAVFARFSSWVIAPVLFGTLVGKWLDNKYNGGQWIFLGVLGFAFVVSMVGLIYEASREFKRIEKDQQNKDDEAQKN